MPQVHAALSNCYIPLPYKPPLRDNDTKISKKERVIRRRDSGSSSHNQQPQDKSTEQQRSAHALRLLRIETGSTSTVTGSALVELGHTKVLCEVIGPTTLSSDYNTNTTTLNMDEGVLQCDVSYIPNIGFPVTSLVGSSLAQLASDNNAQAAPQLTVGRMNTMIREKEQELSSQLLASLAAAVPLQSFPKNVIVIRVTILQDDGSILSACTTAASLALINANIEVYDIITSCMVAVILDEHDNGTKKKKSKSSKNPPLLLADPTNDEIAQADAVVTLSLLANWKEVTLWDQSGRLSAAVSSQALELCRDGCRTMHRFMRNALLQQDPHSSEDDPMTIDQE